MDLKSMSLEQLKCLVYDHSVQVAQIQDLIRAANQEISIKVQEPEKKPVAVKKA
jgi:hypothetical protein